MTIKEAKVQVSNRQGGRQVFSVNIPSEFAKALFLKGGQILKVHAIMKRTGEFRIGFEGKVEHQDGPSE